jgi:hypothetical protein
LLAADPGFCETFLNAELRRKTAAAPFVVKICDFGLGKVLGDEYAAYYRYITASELPLLADTICPL